MSDNVYSKKSYGLLLSNKVANAVQKTKNVFADDSDSEGEASGTTDWMRKKLQTEAKKKSSGIKVEDESIYQYDEVYEAMQEQKEKESVKYRNNQVEGKKPKYIASLLKSAEDRERERERRVERKVEKERIQEGDQFKDKESFVTAAYREKMEEMEKLQEEERRKDALDNLCEVTKQKDMSGFYRHLYRQTMGEEKGQKQEEEAAKVIKKIDKSSKKYRAKKVESSSSSESSSEDEDSPSVLLSKKEFGAQSSRDDKIEETAQSREDKVEEMRQKLKLEREKREARKRRIDEGEESSENEEVEEKKIKSSKDDSKSKAETPKGLDDAPKEVIIKKPKRDVWKKITVGKALDDAVQRYFDRKSQRTQFPLL